MRCGLPRCLRAVAGPVRTSEQCSMENANNWLRLLFHAVVCPCGLECPLGARCAEAKRTIGQIMSSSERRAQPEIDSIKGLMRHYVSCEVRSQEARDAVHGRVRVAYSHSAIACCMQACHTLFRAQQCQRLHPCNAVSIITLRHHWATAHVRDRRAGAVCSSVASAAAAAAASSILPDVTQAEGSR
jgi:hypothetical protein